MSIDSLIKPAAFTSSSISACVRRRIIQGLPSRLVSTRAMNSSCGCQGWDFGQRTHRFDHVPACACRNIQNMNSLALTMFCLNDTGQDPFQVHSSLSDAAPADAVQIRAVDPASQWSDALRLVFIDVI